MYSGSGPPFAEILKKRNEWCKYDHMMIVNRLKTVAKQLIIITGISWTIPPILIAYYSSSYDYFITFIVAGICIFLSILYVSLFWVIESKKISIYKNAFCISLNPRKIDLNKIKKSIRVLLNNFGIPNKLMFVENPTENFRFEFQRIDNDKIIIEIWSKRVSEIFILINTNHFDIMDHIHELRNMIWHEELQWNEIFQ